MSEPPWAQKIVITMPWRVGVGFVDAEYVNALEAERDRLARGLDEYKQLGGLNNDDVRALIEERDRYKAALEVINDLTGYLIAYVNGQKDTEPELLRIFHAMNNWQDDYCDITVNVASTE